MNILVVSQYFWPENFRINDLVEEWIQRGHVVTVLTGIPNYPDGKIFESYRQKPLAFDQYKGAKVVRVPMVVRGDGSLHLILNYISFVVGGCIWGPWRLRGIKSDVIFVFEPSPITVGIPAIMLAKIKKSPVVFWALDLWPETLAAVGVIRSAKVLSWVGHLVRFIYKNCTLILGQSRSFLGSIAKYCDNSSKIRYFPSWAEEIFTTENFNPAPEIPQRANGFTVMFAGNVGEAQDMPAILDAAEQLRNNDEIRWIIVGDGRKFEWVKAEVARRGLHDKVLLPGRFPVERMPSFYAHADAMLVCLKRDPVFSMTVPGKIQSYLMAGIPLLGMLDGEGAEVIRNAAAGFACDAGDALGLARATLAMASLDPEKRKQLGLNGKKYACQEFGRSRLMNYLESVLREAVALRKTNSGFPKS